MTIQGGRERGLILHKLLEEVLTGETAEDVVALQKRAIELLVQLEVPDAEDPAIGPSSGEMAAAVRRALQLPVVAALRPRLLPEFRVYAGVLADQQMSLTAGVADAVATEEEGRVAAVIDWKSDVDPTPGQVEIYRGQVRDYLAATGAPVGFIIFLTSNRVERVELPRRNPTVSTSA
jgi:exodeoxyribonuclease-5